MKRQLAKSLQFIGVQITNLTNALGDGRATDLIFSRLESLKAERERVSEELWQLETEIAKATVKRPTAEQVCAAWGKIIELWDVLTEAERKEVMNGLVQEVVVTEKDRVHLRLLPFASVHGQFIALNTHLGAERSLNANSLLLLPPIRGTTPLLTRGDFRCRMRS